jgi:hypothetical protein
MCSLISVNCSQIREQAVQSGVVLVLARLLSEDSTTEIVTMSASIIGQVSDVRQFPEDAQRHAVYAALITATSRVLATRRGSSPIDPELSLDALTQVITYCSLF